MVKTAGQSRLGPGRLLPRSKGSLPPAYKSVRQEDLTSDWAGLPSELISCIVWQLANEGGDPVRPLSSPSPAVRFLDVCETDQPDNPLDWCSTATKTDLRATRPFPSVHKDDRWFTRVNGVCRLWRQAFKRSVLQTRTPWTQAEHLVHPLQVFILGPIPQLQTAQSLPLLRAFVVTEKIGSRQHFKFEAGDWAQADPVTGMPPDKGKHLLTALDTGRFETTIFLNAGTMNVVGYVRRRFGQSHFTIQLDAGIKPFIESGLEGLCSANDAQGKEGARKAKKMQVPSLIGTVRYPWQHPLQPRKLKVTLPAPLELCFQDECLVRNDCWQAWDDKRWAGKMPRSFLDAKKTAEVAKESSDRKTSKASSKSSASTTEEAEAVPESKPPRKEGLLLANRMPVWKQDDSGEWRYGVSFQPGPNMPQRVAKASVKNFILQPEGSDAAMLLFGRVLGSGRRYTLDYSPAHMSALQAFAICLTAFR
ncbi:hypothetical protein WJX74_003659 [Apatococcus lobatus]|uniref:Tubby C-terminal domain-containing protein n=2 Tax=Apatococcus TaxID=904362 RepID=A0AAW1SN72_9CHLO